MQIVGEIGRQRHQDLLREAAARRLVSQARGERGRRRRRRAPAPAGPALAEAPLFRGLTRRQSRLLARRAEPMRAEEGSLLSRGDDPSRQLIVLTRGAVEESIPGRRAAVLAAGDLVGLRSMLDPATPAPSVTALTDVEGFVLGRREFWGVMRSIPSLSLELAVRLARDAERAERHRSVDHGPRAVAATRTPATGAPPPVRL